MALYKPKGPYKLWKCVFHTEDGKRVRYVIDRDRTSAALTLLLSNKIKFCHPGVDITEVKLYKRMCLEIQK